MTTFCVILILTFLVGFLINFEDKIKVLNELIKVEEIDFLEWKYIYNNSQNKDITQAWEYGICKQSGDTLAIRLKISTIHGHVIGLVQVIMYQKLKLRILRRRLLRVS